MTPRIALVAALVVLASCGRDVPVARVAAGVGPLGELMDIRVGMRADELVRARPRARIASYYGHEEDLGPSHFSYEVPGSRIPGGKVTPPRMRVGVVHRGKSVEHTYSPATETDCRRMGDVDSTAPRSTSQ